MVDHGAPADGRNLGDELLAAVDQRAARDGLSRSALIRRAIEEHLATGGEAVVDRQIVEGYARVPQQADPWAERAARRSIADEP